MNLGCAEPRETVGAVAPLVKLASGLSAPPAMSWVAGPHPRTMAD